jgi:hypothetical protein
MAERGPTVDGVAAASNNLLPASMIGSGVCL